MSSRELALPEEDLLRYAARGARAMVILEYEQWTDDTSAAGSYG